MLNARVKQLEINHGKSEGVTDAKTEPVRALELEGKQLLHASEILKVASACFRADGVEPSIDAVSVFVTRHRERHGV